MVSTRRALFGGLALVAAWSSACAAADTIKIGVLGVNSGGAAYMGAAQDAGIRLAISEINAAGGINGKKLETVSRDETIRPDVAVTAAKDLLSSEKVEVLLGPMGSNTALAVSEVAREAKVVNFAPSAVADDLTGAKLHKYIFQEVSTSDVDAVRLTSILRKVGAKKVCFTGFDYAFSTTFFNRLRAALPPEIQETRTYLVKYDTTDFNTLISQLAADPCDTIMNQFFGGGFIALVKQAEPFGLFKDKKVVSGGNNGDYLIAAALKDKFPEGMWSFAQDLWYDDSTPALKQYHENLAKLQGKKETDMYAITGYIAVKFLAEGIRKAGTTNGDALAQALEGLTVETPLGPLTIDAKTHRVSKPAFYGPIVSVPGSDIKRMSPVELLR